jgi:hypothetical protein
MGTTQIYLMTLNSPSRRAVRLWTGKSLHSLRHCSIAHIGDALAAMQRDVERLQNDVGKLTQVAEGRGNDGGVRRHTRFAGAPKDQSRGRGGKTERRS